MIPPAAITEWRARHPWPDDAQVEQDLVISRAVVELFSRNAVRNAFLFRGGTALHKLFLAPQHRYSEDIDLVQVTAGPIGPLFDEIRDALEPMLGQPSRKQGRNVVNLIFRFESELPPVRPLRLKVEINPREHFVARKKITRRFGVESPWFTGQCDLPTYELEELLGTKLRALYQRNKGRDLYDLWLGLEQGKVDPDGVVACFLQYMDNGNRKVSRMDVEGNLRQKLSSPSFASDVEGLLRPDTDWNLARAGSVVLERLVALL